MATKNVVTKVWIEEGCIVCDACETTAPDVFEVLEDTCIIRPDAMKPDFTKPRTESIVDAAEECPVDVIKFDTVAEEVPHEQAAPAPTQAAQPAADAESAPVAKKGGTAPRDESKTAAGAKSPERAAQPVLADASASVAGAPDPSIAALLRAATARGGNAGIERSGAGVVSGVERSVRDLPPEARHELVLEAARKAKQQAGASRRAFVGSAALATGWTAFGFGASVSIGPAFGRFMMPNVLEEPDPRVRVGKLQKYLEMNPGDVNEDYKPQGIWMIRLEDRIAALSIICTHLGCIPNWLPNDRKFKCPCHGSGYRPDGINFEGPTPRPLERFRVLVEEGMVTVDKSKKYQYELGQWDMPGSFLAV